MLGTYLERSSFEGMEPGKISLDALVNVQNNKVIGCIRNIRSVLALSESILFQPLRVVENR